MQSACAIFPSVACPNIQYFPNDLINGKIFGKKFPNTKYVFWVSLQILSETFLILRITERDIIKKYIGLHVKYRLFLLYFNET